MSRTIRQILKDPNRTGAELGLVLMEKLRNQVTGESSVITDKEILSMMKELSAAELGVYTLYDAIHSTLLNIYNFSRQTTFKFYTSYNAIMTMQDKIRILNSVNIEENTPAKVRDTVKKCCPTLDELKNITKETYDMMFDAISFIEASNTYIRLVLSYFNITGLSCLQFNTEDFYAMLEKMNESTLNIYNTIEKGSAELAKEVFIIIGEPEKKEFLPEPRNLSEFKDFLKNEPNRVIKNAFSFIMLLQKKRG